MNSPKSRSLTRISDPIIAVAASAAMGDAPYDPLTSKAVHEAVGALRLAELHGPELGDSVKAWILMSPEGQRRHIVRQTGLSWTSGNPADSYARSLVGIHGDAPTAFQILQTEVLSGRAPEDQAWWTLVEAELHTLMERRN